MDIHASNEQSSVIIHDETEIAKSDPLNSAFLGQGYNDFTGQFVGKIVATKPDEPDNMNPSDEEYTTIDLVKIDVNYPIS